MSVKMKSNSEQKQLTEISDINILRNLFYFENISRIRIIRGSSGEIFIAFDLDEAGNSRRVLELNGSKIIYFMQVNGQVTEKYWEK